MPFRIDSRPRVACVRAPVDAATNFSDLIRVAHKDLVAIARVYQNAGEVAERKISAAYSPRRATIMRTEECLLRADVDVIGSLRILGDHVHRNVLRNAVNPAPRLSIIARHEHARTRRSHPDCFRLARRSGDSRHARVEISKLKPFPTLCRIDAAIETAAGSREKCGLLSLS